MIIFGRGEIKLKKNRYPRQPLTESILRIASTSSSGPDIAGRAMLEIFVSVTNISEEMDLFLAGE